jgi:hypothetical protein
LEASGRVVLLVGAPDSDMFLGWFNSVSTNQSRAEIGNFLGIHVGGPTRVGHYFQPAYATKAGTIGRAKTGPVLVPEKVYEWTLRYDPAGNAGSGVVRVTLGQESVTLDLKPGDKLQGALFDRFGLFTSTIGGQMVRVYFDDLKYTVRARSP